MNNQGIRPLFLNLLSAAIWDKPADATLFKELGPETWREIAEMAVQQTVSALIADKSLSLPKKSLPPRKQILQFINVVDKTEELNRKMIRVLSELEQEYKTLNLPFCLLKGLANAMYYPSPLHRNVGDLDLFIYQKGDYEKSKEWMIKKGYKIQDGHHMHYSFRKESILIENHRRFTFFDNKKYDNLLKKWEEELIKEDNFSSIKINQLTVRQLPVEMNAFFIFQHMFRHFVHEGVGFRQFCDWILFLSKHRNNIDPVSYTALAKSYALFYPMQVFARAASKYLNTPETVFPFEMIQDDTHADLVITDIFNSGNFGYHRPGKQRPKDKLRGLWFSYKSTLRRTKKLYEISPEHIRILPLKILIYRFKIGFK